MGVAMLLPALMDLRDGNPDCWIFFKSSIVTLMVATLALLATRGESARFSARLGFLLTACLWFTAAFLGALPIYFSHLPISFAAATFESVSGVTATGATVLTGLDNLPRGLLLWRSLLSWIGGIGFIALALLLLPSLRVGGIQLFHMESSDKSEKILPRVNQIANGIIIAYLGTSLLCIICYFSAGMTMFDAINHGMSTVATAGFSTHDSSLGFYVTYDSVNGVYTGKPLILVVATVFMLLSALPFVLYLKLLLPGQRHRFNDPQVGVFLAIVLICSLILTIWLRISQNLSLHHALALAVFHFVSVVTTTGYTVEDYLAWGPPAIGIFFLATFIGGCAGSTSGGIKINRLIILWHLTTTTLTRLISPHAVVKVRYGGSEVSSDIAQTVLLYLCLYMTSLVIGAMLLVSSGLDFVSAFTGALTALSNVGPGLSETIGPVGNFSTIADYPLWILSFMMLTGRLEIVTVFILFTPAFWRK